MFFSVWQAASHFAVNNVNPLLQCKAVHLYKNIQSPARVQRIFAHKVLAEASTASNLAKNSKLYEVLSPSVSFSPLKRLHVFLLKMLFLNILEIGKNILLVLLKCLRCCLLAKSWKNTLCNNLPDSVLYQNWHAIYAIAQTASLAGFHYNYVYLKYMTVLCTSN